MLLTANKIVEVTLKHWEEMGKEEKEFLIKWNKQAHMMQRFIDGFIEGYIEERKERLSKEELKDLDIYKKEVIEKIAGMGL